MPMDEVFDAFIKNEATLSALYQKYSTLFPADSVFWQEIAGDEKTHAGWVIGLADSVNKGLVLFDADRLKIEPVNAMISYTESKIHQAETEPITQIQALSISMDLENSMLERNLFESYESDNAELKEVLDKLRHSTEVHYSEVKSKWQEEKGVPQES